MYGISGRYHAYEIISEPYWIAHDCEWILRRQWSPNHDSYYLHRVTEAGAVKCARFLLSGTHYTTDIRIGFGRHRKRMARTLRETKCKFHGATTWMISLILHEPMPTAHQLLGHESIIVARVLNKYDAREALHIIMELDDQSVSLCLRYLSPPLASLVAHEIMRTGRQIITEHIPAAMLAYLAVELARSNAITHWETRILLENPHDTLLAITRHELRVDEKS